LYQTLELRVEERTRQLVERNRQLTGLQEISIKVVSQIELDEVLGSITETVYQLLSADFCTLFTYDAELDQFEGGIRRGIIEVEPSIPGNKGFSAKIAKTQTSVFINDTENNTFSRPTFVHNKKVKSFAGVPLVVGEETVGVLFVNFFDAHIFTQEEQEFIGLVANPVAVGIKNAKLYSELQEEKRALSEVGENIAPLNLLGLMSQMTVEFSHKMNNLAGTIPARINIARRYLNSDDPQNAHVIEQLDKIARDTELILQAARDIKRTTETRAEEDIAINQLLEQAIARVWFSQPNLEERLKLVKDFGPGLPVLSVERNRLLDTLVNVIRNAVQAMPEEGVLKITTRKASISDAPCIEIAISDTGTGISPDDLTKIFDLFFTTKEEGLGFGLWRDKRFIRGLGGDIEVQSQEGSGSTFLIKIPIKAQIG